MAEANGVGNNVTRIPGTRLYLDPFSDAQGKGFWAGKFNPDGRKTEGPNEALGQGAVTPHQERGEAYEANRYFEDTPDEEEETIKSMVKRLESSAVFGLAKKALENHDKTAYRLCKAELESRAFMVTIRKALGEMAKLGEEESTEDKDELSVAVPKEKSKAKAKKSLIADMRKAIGTKSSEARERPQKKSKPPPKGKVTSTKSGKKNYDYRNDAAKPKKPAMPTAAGKPTTNDEPSTEVQPEKLATQLGMPIEKLQQLAGVKSEEEFVTYFKAKGASFVRKHGISDTYLTEVYAVLKRDSADKSLEPEMKKKPNTLAKKFKVRPDKLKKGTEERAFAQSLVTSKVTTLGQLATFISKAYDLSLTQAKSMAVELHRELKTQGALH